MGMQTLKAYINMFLQTLIPRSFHTDQTAQDPKEDKQQRHEHRIWQAREAIVRTSSKEVFKNPFITQRIDSRIHRHG
jgi:hypothetical protein